MLPRPDRHSTTDLSAAALTIDADGWCPQAQHHASPNCDVRPDAAVPELLVIHNISLPPRQFGGPFIGDLFCNRLDYEAHPYFDQLRSLRVSAHFVIQRDGQLLQFVSASARAWHAGVSCFNGRERCNDFSIGIELEGTDVERFTELQYAVLIQLTIALQHRYKLTDVTGHEHIAPGRKTDPGPFFDWDRYAADWQRRARHAQLRFSSGPPKVKHGTNKNIQK